jgi:triacylglycerol lipase
VSLLANAYTHCLNEVSLTAAEAAAVAAAGFDALKQSAGTASEGGHDPALVDQMWGLVKSRISSHLIANYQSRVEAKCKELG